MIADGGDSNAPRDAAGREGAPPGNLSGRTDNMEDIARRLDELLRAMADLPEPQPGTHTAEDGMVGPARLEYRARRERERVFGAGILADPAWDILLDLFIARNEEREVTVFSVSRATAVAESVVLRCIAHLVDAKLVARGPHAPDPGSIRLLLTERAIALMCDYFSRTTAIAGGAGA
jgi:hypothetical protein